MLYCIFRSVPACLPFYIQTDVIWAAILKFTVLILPCIFLSDGFHDIPVLRDLTVLDSPQVIVRSGSASEASFGNCQNIVPLGKNLMHGIVNHLNALLAERFKRRAETGKTIRNACVVLNIGIAVKVGSCFFGSFPLHDIVQEVLDELAVLLGLIEIFQRIVSVNLRMTGRIRFSLCCEVVPMFGNLAVGIEAEDVESDLFTGSGKIVDGLQEDLVSILKSTDVIDGGLYGSACEVGNAAYECVRAGAIGEVMLNVAGSKKRLRLLAVSACECVNESQSFFFVCHVRILLGNLRVAFLL